MRDGLIGGAVGGLIVWAMAHAWQAQAVGSDSASPERESMVPTSEVGRFQIVNGTPQYAANIMLIDTVSGDSWVQCKSPDTSNLWCKQERSENSTSPGK